MSSLSMGTEVVILSDAPSAQVEIDMQWTVDDPLAVTLFFGPRYPLWRISRDQLAVGIDRPVGGDGDVMIAPSPYSVERVEVVLSTPSGRCSVVMDRIDVDAFLQATYARCALGAEVLHVPEHPGCLVEREGETW